MKKLLRSVIIIALCMIIASTNTISTSAQQSQGINTDKSAGQVTNPWYTEYVHQGVNDYEDFGEYPSMLFVSKYAIPEIIYYNAYTADLFDAIRSSTGCPGSLSWGCLNISGGQAVEGEYASADTWQGAIYWKTAASYHDSTNNTLRVVETVWSYNGSMARKWHTIEEGIDPAEVGYYTSLKYFPDGTIGIVYTIVHPDYNELKYAYSVDGGGNCGIGDSTGYWNCEFIYIGGLGKYNSLDIAWNDIPVVSTYDTVFGDLWVAYYVGSGGLCGAWECVYIDGAGEVDVGRSTSVSAPQQSGDPLRIAYYDYTNSKLKFYNSDWGVPMFVDDMALGLQPGISMDIDPQGYTVIAYQRAGQANSPKMLGIARPYLVYNDGEYGNCGDILPGLGEQYWRCSTIEAGDYYHLMADYVSVQVNSNNTVGVAYTERNTSLNTTSLKFASQYHLTYVPILSKP